MYLQMSKLTRRTFMSSLIGNTYTYFTQSWSSITPVLKFAVKIVAAI